MSNRRSAPPPPPTRDSSVSSNQIVPHRIAPAPPSEANKQLSTANKETAFNTSTTKCPSCGFALPDDKAPGAAANSDKIRKLCLELVTKVSQKTCLSELRSVDLLEDVLERLVVGMGEPESESLHPMLEELHRCKVMLT